MSWGFNARRVGTAMLWIGLVARGAAGQASGSRPGHFEFTLKTEALTSAGVFDATGHLVRPLWALRTLGPGTHSGDWDGRDQFDQPAPRGDYEYRVVVNRGRYRNVAIIGNTGRDVANHTPGTMRSVALDGSEAVYTANDWEEAGADFKKWSADGTSLYNAEFQIRNGNPNGFAYAIAVDDRHLYCAVAGWPRAPFNGKQQVQRFRASDGKAEPFTEVRENAGHLQLHEWPDRAIPFGTSAADAALMKQPLRALAVAGETLWVCDALGGKVHRFHKETGRRLGSFPVRLPMALALAADGRVWVGHEHGKVTAFGPDGSGATPMIGDLGEVRSLAFGPADRLYVADGGTQQVKIYATTRDQAKLIGGFGRRAVPGDSEADRFYDLQGVAVDRRGGFVTIQNLPVGGARLTRWSAVGQRLWEQSGLEFVSLGTYARSDPDTFVSLQFNRYVLAREGTPHAQFNGNLFDGDPRYQADVHGVPRLVKIGTNTFFFTARGDGMQVYRRDGDAMRLSAMVGGREPTPDGRRDQSGPLGQWTWHDLDGDGGVSRDEVRWYRRPGAGKYSVLGMNVDEQGNLLYCEQESRAVWEMPLLGVDPHGNPRYDWARARIVIPRDRSRARLSPLMAVRSPEGTLYAFSRSETWREPKNEGAWMGGWALSAHDARGSMLWETPLPQVCVGMDAVPGGGVVLGWYEKAHVFHYNADGLLVGTAMPGPAAGGMTGWLDNTAALSANRDPRDQIVDVFTSDNYLYRILWYRIDDRPIETLRGTLRL